MEFFAFAPDQIIFPGDVDNEVDDPDRRPRALCQRCGRERRLVRPRLLCSRSFLLRSAEPLLRTGVCSGVRRPRGVCSGVRSGRSGVLRSGCVRSEVLRSEMLRSPRSALLLLASSQHVPPVLQQHVRSEVLRSRRSRLLRSGRSGLRRSVCPELLCSSLVT